MSGAGWRLRTILLRSGASGSQNQICKDAKTDVRQIIAVAA